MTGFDTENAKISVRTAVLLIGGHGTRLRPLTITTPKPMLHICNRPIVEFLLDQFVEVGVTRFILACPNTGSNKLQEEILRIRENVSLKGKTKVEIIMSVEKTPLGTGGPLKLAEPYLEHDPDFFVMNSDIVAEVPLGQMIHEHRSRSTIGTMLMTKVEDPSRFGVLTSDQKMNRYETKSVELTGFIEKPSTFVGNWINGGVYLFKKSILDYIPSDEPCSLERDVFPSVLKGTNNLRGVPIHTYWIDIGSPLDFLKGHSLILSHRGPLKDEAGENQFLTKEQADKLGVEINGPVYVHKDAIIESGSKLGPNVSIGKGCIIESSCRIRETCVMEGTIVKKGSVLLESIIAKDCTIGAWSRLIKGTIVANDVKVEEETMLNGPMVLPHVVVKEDLLSPGEIVLI